MVTLAKITGAILVIFGILVIIAGIIIAVVGGVRLGQVGYQTVPGFPGTTGLQNMMAFGASLFFGIVVFFEGLIVTAAGELVYLVADLVDNTRRTNRLLNNSTVVNAQVLRPVTPPPGTGPLPPAG